MNLLCSDFIRTRAGRIDLCLGAGYVWWTFAGVLASAGHASPLMVLGVVPGWLVLLQLRAFPAFWRQVAVAMSSSSAVAFAAGCWAGVAALADPHPHPGLGAFLVVLTVFGVLPFAAMVVMGKTLPAVELLSPELRPWITGPDAPAQQEQGVAA